MTKSEQPTEKPKAPRKRRAPKTRLDGLLDEMIAEAGGPSAVAGPDGLLMQLTSALVNRALQAELSVHLGYDAGDEPPDDEQNRRNGVREKTVRADGGEIAIKVPRDRDGTFEPILVKKHQRSFAGFDDRIISMYARGMTTREIVAHFQEVYGADVSPDLVSRVTDAVIAEIHEWQTRPLESVYPIVYIDALYVKVRDHSVVQNKAVYIVVGVGLDGQKDVLGLWIQKTEGAKFWLTILEELKTRGVKDILVLCADGLTGLPDAVLAAFPRTVFQTCIVHLVRTSTRYVPDRDIRLVCKDLKQIYTSVSVEAALKELDAFEAKWGSKYPLTLKAWRSRVEEWTPFLAFPAEIRRAIYTTNAIEALNRMVRKTLKARGALPNDDAVMKLVFLAVRNATKTWGKPATYWPLARAQFVILFEDRWPTEG